MGTPILRSTPSFSSHFDDAHYVDQLSSNHYFYPKFQGCMSREKNSADFQELYVMIRYMNYSCSLLTALQYITHSSYYSNILQLVIISQNVEYFFFFCRSNPVYQQELHHYHHLLHVLLLRTHSSQFQGFCFTKSCREMLKNLALFLE